MLAIRPTTDRTSCPPAGDLGHRSQPGRGVEHDTGLEGVIYSTPDGDGYILYATSRPCGAGAGPTAT
jgi:hypothetical protein